MPRFQQHGLEPRIVQPVVEPLRQRTSFQADPHDGQIKPAQELGQRLGLARDLRLPDDLACRVQHAQAAQLQRHVNPNMVFHGRPPDGRTRTARVRTSRHHSEQTCAGGQQLVPGAGPLRHLPEPQVGRASTHASISRQQTMAVWELKCTFGSVATGPPCWRSCDDLTRSRILQDAAIVLDGRAHLRLDDALTPPGLDYEKRLDLFETMIDVVVKCLLL